MLDRLLLFVFVGSALLAGAGAAPLAAQAMAPADAVESPAAAVGTAITYQGLLTQAGSPAAGIWDFEFLLFDAAAGPAQLGSTVTVGDLAVSAGVFTATLNFGVGVFGGGARWLEIHVRPGASGGAYTTLSPRAPLTPAPIALSLPGVYADEALSFVGSRTELPDQRQRGVRRARGDRRRCLWRHVRRDDQRRRLAVLRLCDQWLVPRLDLLQRHHRRLVPLQRGDPAARAELRRAAHRPGDRLQPGHREHHRLGRHPDPRHRRRLHPDRQRRRTSPTTGSTFPARGSRPMASGPTPRTPRGSGRSTPSTTSRPATSSPPG